MPLTSKRFGKDETMTAMPPNFRVALVGFAIACSMSGCGIFSRDEVHGQWQNRSTLPACGEVSLSPFDVLEEAGASGLRCLHRGIDSGRGGELVVHYPTAEGDPITDYLRVTTKGTTEIYTDSTRDENSDQRWSYGRCANPGPTLDFVC